MDDVNFDDTNLDYIMYATETLILKILPFRMNARDQALYFQLKRPVSALRGNGNHDCETTV